MAMHGKLEDTFRAPQGDASDPIPPTSQITPAELPPTAIVLAAKAKDLDALRTAVVDAASVGAALWFSYLFVLFYLLIAVGGVTHRDLFFENPVKLPFLNVDLPLVGFFMLGPALFLVVHAYVLLHLVLLAGKVGVFHAELKKQIADDDLRARLRRQLPSNIFVQILAGPREVRTGVLGFMLRLMAQTSLVAGPIALLVFFQLQFLPYHHEAVTWWQRIAVIADLALLWILWPSVARGEIIPVQWRPDTWRNMLRNVPTWKIAATTLAGLAPILLVFTIATFPGEWLQDNLPSVRFIPVKEVKYNKSSWRRLSLHEVVVAGEVDYAARKTKSFWSNRLVLPGLDIIDPIKFNTEAKIAALPLSASLRARHLEGAVLIGANLRKADFTAARLQGALLDRADLRDAKFECERGGVDDFPFQTPCAELERASLDSAQLQGASLDGARLQGASLDHAQLQGAWLRRARLQGASLEVAELLGARLDSARLQGAYLFGASFQGAYLANAQLQGAYLAVARLQGAILNRTRLQGALLDDAELQGASLDRAQLQGASLRHVFAWRADIRVATTLDARVFGAVTGPETDCLPYRGEGPTDHCEWSVASFERLREGITDQVPKPQRDEALERIKPLDPTQKLTEEENIAKAWADLAGNSPAANVYEKVVAEEWRKIGCAADGAPYVVRGLLGILTDEQSSPFELQSQEARVLAAAFLEEVHCAGARGLSEEDKVKLRELRDRQPR